MDYESKEDILASFTDALQDYCRENYPFTEKNLEELKKWIANIEEEVKKIKPLVANKKYIFVQDYYYDSVDNLLDAGWNKVIDTLRSLGFEKDEKFIIPKGTQVKITDDEVNHFYIKATFDSGKWIPILKDDTLDGTLEPVEEESLQESPESDNVYEWYKKRNPNDYQLENIDKNVTFKQVYDYHKQDKDVEDILIDWDKEDPWLDSAPVEVIINHAYELYDDEEYEW